MGGVVLKTILLTGATGFVGRVLTESLIKQGYIVKVVLRSSKKASNDILFKNCKIFTPDDTKPDLGLTIALQSVDVVIHLAARVHIMHDYAMEPIEEFRKVNVEFTKQLVNLSTLSGVKRFVFLSSLHVNGNNSIHNLFHETDTPKPTSPYAISKLEAEQILKELAVTANMEFVIIRPPLVYGPNVKANFLSLLKLTKTGLPLPIGLLNNKRSMINVHNLVNFIVHCMEHLKAANETFLISDDNDISTKELFAKLIKLFGKRPLLLPIFPKLLYALGVLLGKKTIVDRLCAPLQVDITKAKTLLNWKPIQTIDEGLKETVDWYKKEYI